jgi:hypothetical protein
MWCSQLTSAPEGFEGRRTRTRIPDPGSTGPVVAITRNFSQIDGEFEAFDNRKTWNPFSVIPPVELRYYVVRPYRKRCTMSVKEFLKQRAVNITVGGHYTLGNWFDAQGRPRTAAFRRSA